MSLIKWYGSKRRIVDWLNEHIPPSEYTVDLFFGSGSFSFSRLKEGLTKKVIAWDLNPDLVNFWHVIQQPENHEKFLSLLSEDRVMYEASPQGRFEDIKEIWNNVNLTKTQRAAAFYVLNKTSFNGLFRTNGKGEFNTSWSKDKSYRIPSLAELRQYSGYMSHVYLRHGSYEEYLDNEHLHTDNSIVYLDPPYLAKKSDLVNYGVEEFNHMDLILKLYNLGKPCYLSHTATPEFEDLMSYFPARRVRRVTKELTHIANSKAVNRVPKKEALYIIQ